MYKYTYIHIYIYTYTACMCIHTCIYTYVFHSMWTSQKSTRYVWEAKSGVPDEKASSASLVSPATSYENVKRVNVKFSRKYAGCKRHRYIMSI